MSADDFQTKYASVMDSMLKSAIAETTKLFETMVDELKAEISRIKKENEDLKTRCSRFENASSQPTFYTRESEPLPGRSDRCEKRDTAVQCDLVSFCTMLVEQDQPLSHSSLQSQKQQCSHEEMEYALQEHNYTYGGGNAEMAFILVKQEQEEVESTMVYRQVLSDKADSPWASACGTENQGPFINRVCSTREIPLSERHEETQVALELPSLGTCSGLQDAQNQSSEQEHSVVISLSAIKDDLEEESEVNQKISEGGSQGEFKTSEKHQLVVAQPHEPPEKEQQLVVPRQCQRESEMLVNEQTDITQQQNADAQSTQEQFAQTKSLNNRQACDELKNEVPEVGSHQPDLSVQCRRGQQPKKAKHLKPVKEILQSSSDIPAEQEVKKSPAIRVEEVEVSSTVDIVHITSSESPQTCPVQPKDPNIALEGVENTEVGSLVVSVASLSRGCSSEMEKTRKSRHLSMVMEEGTIQTPATEISSAIETPAESPQALSVQSKDDNTSVTLQDAMLLVEAMNQSMVENTFSSLQLMATPPQAQCVPHVGAVQTVDEVSAEPPLPVETHEAIGTLPITELSATTQSTIEELSGLLQATGTTPTNEAEADMKVVIQKQQQAVFLSKTTTSSVPPPAAAIQRSVQSFHRHHPYPLITLVAPSRRGNTVPHKIIVVPRSISSLMPHKLTAQSTNQLPAVVSIVDAAQNSSVLSTAAGLPLRAPSSFPVSQKTLYVTSSKSLPVVRPSTTTSVDLQSGSLPPKKTIRIPRQVSAVASRKHQLQTIVLTAQQESNKSSSPVMVSPPQFISSSQESSVSVGTQTASGKVLIKSSQNVDNTPDNFESPKQTASVSETINAHTETCSSLSMSVGLVPPSKSPAVPPTLEQQLSAVVRLTRLPFPISTKESVFVSRLPPNGSSDSQSILKKSCVVIPTQPPETLVLSTDIRSSLKEASLAVSANTSQMSEEPDDIQEKASLTAENCIPLEESPSNGYFQPSTPSKVSQPVFEKSAVAINMTEFSAVSGTAAEHTSNLDEEIGIAAQDGVLPNGPSIEEIQSPALIHLTSSASKDTSDPQLQMLKTQFLPQLAVSPVEQDAKKASWSDSIDARASCAEPSTSDNKGLRKKSLMAQLQSHIKMHFQARRSETNPEPHTETRTHTVSPKKSRSENDHPNDQNITSEPIPLSPKNPGVLEDVTSLKKTSNDPTPIIPRRSGLCVNVVEPQETVNESSVSLRTAVAKNESASVSPRRSSSTAESVTSKKIKQTCVRLRRTVSTRNGASPKNTNNGDSPNNIKTNSVTSKRTSSSRDGTSPKKTKYTSVSPGTSGLSKISTSSKISTNESTSVNHRKCTFTKDGSSTKQNKRESNSISPRKCSTTTDGARTKNTKSETYSQSVRWPKLAKDGASPRKAGKSASPRLIQDGTCPEINPRVVNDKLSKAADAKTIAKMKNAKQSELQNGAKTSQLAENSGSCKAVKKCTAKAVWTPPRMPTGKTLPAGEKMSVHFPVKKETVSQDRTVVYPPSVPLHPIPVKAPPVVSPLQPLSVIGRRLLKNQCGECGRVLSSSVALESHVSLHKGRRPFSCTLCGKRFADAKGLKRHGRVHRNGRIHMCQKCGKGFVYRFCLTKHLQMVHSRIKPFVCQMCDKGFFTKRDVEAHIRVHTGEKPFHCNLCEKKFARRVELNVHLRWHNGEKRHWCPYCGKGFLDFNNLKRHKYTHTGEKPHSCPYCPKNFTQSGHLKKHVKNVHKIQ